MERSPFHAGAARAGNAKVGMDDRAPRRQRRDQGCGTGPHHNVRKVCQRDACAKGGEEHGGEADARAELEDLLPL